MNYVIWILQSINPYYLAPLDDNSSLCYEICKEANVLQGKFHQLKYAPKLQESLRIAID